MITPNVTLSNGETLTIKGVDAGKAPAIAEEYKNAASPEQAIATVTEAINLGVPLWTGHVWISLNPAHVISVWCLPYD